MPVHVLDKVLIVADGQDVVFVDGKRERHSLTLFLEIDAQPAGALKRHFLADEKLYGYRRLWCASMSNIFRIRDARGDIIFIFVEFVG